MAVGTEGAAWAGLAVAGFVICAERAGDFGGCAECGEDRSEIVVECECQRC